MKEIVEIFDISYEGAGVGKIDGCIVFVPKTQPGECVEIEVVKKTSSFILGKLVKVLKPSKERVLAPCPYFDVCGGCDFQHCSKQQEQNLKIKILKKELAKVGFDGAVDFVASSKRFSYRNKIKLEVLDGKLGYFKAKTHQFFEIKSCLIAHEKILEALPSIENFLSVNAFKRLKNVYIKEVNGDVAICFLFDKNERNVMKNAKNLQILDSFSVFFAFGEVLESDQTKVFYVCGKKVLAKKYAGFWAEVDVRAFSQINDEIAQKMYEFLVERTACQRVVNAYSGQGVLTRLICERAKFVYGIELQKSAHEIAQKLTKDLQNVENLCGKVEEKLSGILLRDRIDTIVLDPAREGCKKEALDAILGGSIDSVVYVSCNFATLTRDLQILLQKYSIENVTIFDMFPCTCNMESVVFLKAK